MNPSDPTRAEIAGSYTLWGTFVDPSGLDTRERFDAMTEAAKFVFMDDCFGPETPVESFFQPENCAGCNAPTNNAEGGRCADCSTDE